MLDGLFFIWGLGNPANTRLGAKEIQGPQSTGENMPVPDPATEGLPQISPEQAPQLINLLLKLLSGAAMKNISKSGKDLQEQGIDPRQFIMDPLVRAGAGVEALGISPELILSMMKQPQQDQQKQQEQQIPVQQMIASLSAKLQGDRGLVPQQLPQQGPPPGAGPPAGGGVPPPPRFPG